MYTDKLKQAEELFFHTDLNKTEIADALGIARRTLHYWVRDNDWERLKLSARHMPMMLTENIYYAMNKLLESVLSENRMMQPITKQEADTLHRLTLTINKLGRRTSVNESMEVLSFFMEDVATKDKELSQRIAPFIKSYIQSSAAIKPYHFTPAKFNDMGCIPVPPQEPTQEQRLDLEDIMAWSSEQPIAPQQQSKESEPTPSLLPREGAEGGRDVCEERSNLTQHDSRVGSHVTPPSPLPGSSKVEKAAERSLTREEYLRQEAAIDEAYRLHITNILKGEQTSVAGSDATPPSPVILSSSKGERAGERSKLQHPNLNRKQRRALERQNKLATAA